LIIYFILFATYLLPTHTFHCAGRAAMGLAGKLVEGAQSFKENLDD
jgi:hypothetical protein